MKPRRLARWLLAASLSSIACGPREKVVVMHPEGSDAARALFHVAFVQRVTLPDNFVLRPDEFAAVTVDHARNLIYAGSREGSLLALDHDTGDVVWEKQLEGAVSCRPTIADLPGEEGPRVGASLLVGTDNGALIAFDLDSHAELWRYQTDGKVRTPPVVTQGIAYFVNSRDQVFALDIRTGTWRWQYEQELQTDFTIHGHAGLTFVPSAAESVGEVGTLYTGFENGKVAAIGAASGEALWLASVAPPEGGNFIDSDTTPIVDTEAKVVYVAGQQTGVFALSQTDGSVLWRFDARGVSNVIRGRARDLIATSSLEGVISLTPEGQQVWRTQVGPGVLSAPVLVDDIVYATHSESGLLAFDAETGEFMARIDLGSGMSSVPVFDATTGRFYATTNRGLLLALQIESAAPGAWVPPPSLAASDEIVE